MSHYYNEEVCDKFEDEVTELLNTRLLPIYREEERRTVVWEFLWFKGEEFESVKVPDPRATRVKLEQMCRERGTDTINFTVWGKRKGCSGYDVWFSGYHPTPLLYVDAGGERIIVGYKEYLEYGVEHQVKIGNINNLIKTLSNLKVSDEIFLAEGLLSEYNMIIGGDKC